MKKMVICCLLCLLVCMPSALAAGTAGFAITEIGVTTAFPANWTVVTPASVAQHFSFFEEASADIAAGNMRTEGVYAVAFSPNGDAMLRVIMQKGDADAALYHDIDRYTNEMRNAIKDDFLDKEAWSLTGYRYTEATWTNKEGQGRLLNLAYTIRAGEEIVARGLQTYTVRNGAAFTLDLQVKGRKLEREDERIFADFVESTVYPAGKSAPLLPVGLTLTGTVPEETHKDTLTISGETTKGAVVKAWVLPPDGEQMTDVGQIKAGGGGTFKLEIKLPSPGDWRLYIKSELDGYEPSEDGRWISYDPKRIPVTFTSYPEGVVTDSQIIVSGKTISGVTIQCMEGDENKKRTTGSDGNFSFKLDRAIVGDRQVVLSLTKKNYDNRRFDIAFNRQWARADHVKYLSEKVQSLSYENLSTNPEKYVGRLVRYSGEVLDVSSAGSRVYVQLGMKQDKEGAWTERIVAFADGLEVLLTAGDMASLYIEVTTETFAFSGVTAEGDEIDIDLPAVKLLTYEKKE